MRLIDADKLSSDMEFVFENARGMTALAARLVWAFIEKAETVDVTTQVRSNCGADMRGEKAVSKEEALDALEHLMYSSPHEATQSVVAKKHYKEILLRFMEQAGCKEE